MSGGQGRKGLSGEVTEQYEARDTELEREHARSWGSKHRGRGKGRVLVCTGAGQGAPKVAGAPSLPA